MSDNPLTRRTIAIAIPIPVLLDALAGRVILKLPSSVPEGSEFFSSHLDTEHQILRITVTHPAIDPRDFDDPIRCLKVIAELPEDENDENDSMQAGPAGNPEDWNRTV
jgi:hypothetical protein